MAEIIATNKKAFRDYFLHDKWECGIVLTGGEVKSLRQGKVNFKDSFARIEDGNVNLYNMHISPYKQASYMNESADRVRRLLLHKNQIRKIASAVSQRNMSLVPTKIYFNNRGLVKVEIALGKGKRLYDKREVIQKRAVERALNRIMTHRRR